MHVPEIRRLTCLSVQFSGGEEVLLDVAGQDSTEAFEDVGHSDEAREILEGLKVGTLKRLVYALLCSASFSSPHIGGIILLTFLSLAAW